MTNAVVSIQPRASLVQKFASKFSIEPEKLMAVLKATAFKQGERDPEVTNEQMAALLVVADQYGLNPFTREIFAFPDKQRGIVPVVGVDGWSRIINDHPESNGFEFRASEKMVTIEDAKPCPEWMEVVIYRKDRAHPIIVREYLDEVYRPVGTYPDGNKRKPGPWQSHTKRFLRHKVLIQGARVAYGFGGIYDEDEAERIVERDITPAPAERAAIEMPKAKDEPAGDAAPAAEKPAQSGEPAAEKKGDLKPSQSRILKAKMESAGLTVVDLEAQFPGKCIEPTEGKTMFDTTEFNEVSEWIASRAQG